MKRMVIRARAIRWANRAREKLYAGPASLDRWVGLVDGYEAGYRAAKRKASGRKG